MINKIVMIQITLEIWDNGKYHFHKNNILVLCEIFGILLYGILINEIGNIFS